MLVLSKTPQVSLSRQAQSRALDSSLRAAAKVIVRARILNAVALSLPFFLLADFFYVCAARFTLAVLPNWPLLLLLIAWAGGLVIWTRRQRVGTGEAARYLDRHLGLDERVSTCVEIINRHRLVGGNSVPGAIQRALLQDVGETLQQKAKLLPRAHHFSLSLGTALAIGGTLLAFTAALVLPTNAGTLRAEHSALENSLRQQLTEVQTLRGEVAANKQLSDDLRSSILSQLDQVQSSLSNPGLDQSSAMAALADSEQKLRTLLQTPSSDFDALVTAAKLVWGAAVNLGWDPDNASVQTDMGKATDASVYLSHSLINLNGAQEPGLTSALGQAASSAAARDAPLGTALSQANDDVRSRDRQKAAGELVTASQRFAALEGQRQNSETLETVLSQLNSGREQIAQIGQTAQHKAQVGFRVRPPANSAANSNSQSTASGGQAGADQQGTATANGDGGDQNGSVGAIPHVGGNAPAYGAGSGGQSSNESPAQVGSGNGPAGGSGVGGGAAGQNSANGGSTAAGQGGGSAGGSGNGQTGTFGGQVTGPVGGTSGAISQVANPSGNGVSAGGATQPSQAGSTQSPGDEVYLPPTPQAGQAGSGANSSATAQGSDPQTSGQGGRVGDGASSNDGSGVISGTGAGSAVQVHTPYKQVIGQYTQQATAALEHTYIPPDAKQYVKDYFSNLGSSK